jgi:hypothetical protein
MASNVLSLCRRCRYLPVLLYQIYSSEFLSTFTLQVVGFTITFRTYIHRPFIPEYPQSESTQCRRTIYIIQKRSKKIPRRLLNFALLTVLPLPSHLNLELYALFPLIYSQQIICLQLNRTRKQHYTRKC